MAKRHITPLETESERMRHRHPIPPHERKNMIYVEFDEESKDTLTEMFGNEEEAEVAINMLHCAPPEQQIVAIQLLRLYGVTVKAGFSDIQPIPVRWASPILGEEIYDVYADAYGDDGIHYVEVLESSPYEISVISRMITYMQKKRGE